MKKILLTGFKPFLSFKSNPTEEIVKSLDGKILNDYQIIGKVLPVEFKQSGTQMIKYIKDYNPNIVISLGIANKRSKITPERIAININDGRKDNAGFKPSGERIIEDGPDGLFSSLPNETIVKALQKNRLPAEISNTAGTYLCNNVMYHSLYYIFKNRLQIKSGFIHIPISHELAIETSSSPSWSYSDLKNAIEISISCL